MFQACHCLILQTGIIFVGLDHNLTRINDITDLSCWLLSFDGTVLLGTMMAHSY